MRDSHVKYDFSVYSDVYVYSEMRESSLVKVCTAVRQENIYRYARMFEDMQL